MFGFATEKNPKGPSPGSLKTCRFDLSGTVFSLQLPDGNCKDHPEPQGSIINNVNIYNKDAYTAGEGVPYIVLLRRSFCYSTFMQPGLGTLQLRIMLRESGDHTTNLFKDNIQEQIVTDITRSFASFNREADMGIYPPTEFTTITTNNQEWLRYEIDDQGKAYPNYCFVISPNHYITIGFFYITEREPDEPWLLMAKQLEQTIMSSVKIDLSPSAKAYTV
ncbi:MAG: hypothetical protein OEZ39_01690 [Gammaproteobacteria bacterium]|nr:hypothetical protein [Gammaproteobacteria bacterium]MDH5650565.1 hypothetical protein [Gammaproteobacteria bacterium]